MENPRAFFKYALLAAGIAVNCICLILTSQFGSFLQPFAVMASLPLSLVGVFVALAKVVKAVRRWDVPSSAE